MSSYASLIIAGEELYSWRNEIEPTFLFLFTKEDVKHVPKPADEADDEEVDYVHLETDAGALAERLDALGIGPSVVEELFNELVGDRIQRFKAYDFMDPDYITPLKGINLSDWVELLTFARRDRVKREARAIEDATSVAGLLEIWESADPRFLVRAALLCCDPRETVTLDVTDLVDGGWLDDDIEPQDAALQYFGHALANGMPAVVLTEGSTDAEFLKASIALRKPHLQSFIRFFDFADGAEGSASAAVRTIKSFAAAGISNRVVLYLDNDAAARDALRSLRISNLPSHYKVLHYPDLPLAADYPTMGPTGEINMNVNGLAASLEMYLGTDVLQGDDGKLSPVQWRSYLSGVSSYQGEILGKVTVQHRFRKKLKVAQHDPLVMESQDWTGMDLLVGALLNELRN